MSRYTNTVPQVIDGNGKPIVGAKKFFFEVGTTTEKTIYSDAAFQNTQTNPVLTDADGRYTDDIFLDGLYDEVQQDNSGTATGYDGVTLWGPKSAGSVPEGPLELWNNELSYDIPDIVLGSNDEYYRSLVDDNIGNNPTSSPDNWEELQFGRVWNSVITYSQGDSVYGSDGFLYLSRTNSNLNNNPISDTTNWRSGAEVQFTKGADIASAAALTLGSDGNYFDVTGTTTITSIATIGVGAIVKLHFDGILTLTHNATSLKLPSNANIITQAGDEVEFYEYTAGNWRCTNYERSDGKAIDDVAPGDFSTGPNAYYLGTSGDGSKTVAASENLAKGEYHYSSLTVDSGQTLGISDTAGYLILRVDGAVSIAGTISANGKGSAGGAQIASATGNPGTDGTGGGSGASGGGGDVGVAQTTGAGGDSVLRDVTLAGGASVAENTAGNNGAAVSQALQNLINSYIGVEVYSMLGGGGGSGTYKDTGFGGAGGRGGGAIIIICDSFDLQASGALTSTGDAGSTGNGNGGGGGGGGGGNIFVLAKTVTNNGTITTSGGAGGGGTTSGGTGGAGYSAVITG